MMYKTHLAVGLLFSLIFLKFFEVNPYLFITATLFFSLLPDIDTPKSKLGEKAKIISWPTKLVFGHRGFLHTIYPALMLFVLFAYFNLTTLALASIIGYLSHFITDMLNSNGVRIFFPLSKMHVGGFIKTGGIFEYIFLLGILFLIFFLVKNYYF